MSLSVTLHVKAPQKHEGRLLGETHISIELDEDLAVIFWSRAAWKNFVKKMLIFDQRVDTVPVGWRSRNSRTWDEEQLDSREPFAAQESNPPGGESNEEVDDDCPF